MSPVRAFVVIVAIIIGILAGVLAAWRADHWVKVEPGEYIAIESAGTANGDAVQGIEKLSIDRATGTATFALLDGSLITTRFVARDRSVWPAGCPSNARSTRMEVLDLQVDDLVIGPTAYPQPILVRDCPKDPLRVVLRSDGEIGGVGGACLGASLCVRFAADECGYDEIPNDAALPRSMKGYELYSWQSNRQWHFTLITGTNRPKTLAEVTSCQNVIEGEWLKTTVRGVHDLKALLAMLPRGAYVGWRGSLGPGSGARAPGESLEILPNRTVSEIQSHCSDLGIELHVVR